MHPPPHLRPRLLHSSTIIASYFVSAALYRSTRSIRLLRMLPRTLRHSRSAPALRGAISPAQHPSQAHLHTSSSALKSAAPAPPGTPTSPTKSWRERTVVELRAELKRRGLSTTGKKDDLVNRLSNANINFGTAEAMGAVSSSSPTKALRAKKSMPSLKASSMSTPPSTPFSSPVKPPPVPKIPEIYSAPTIAPILKINPQSLTSSMSNLRISNLSPSSSPLGISPALVSKGSFANLRAASTLSPTKQVNAPVFKTAVSPKRKMDASPVSSPSISRAPSSSQIRNTSTLTSTPTNARVTPSSTPTSSPPKLSSQAMKPSHIPIPKSRPIHSSTPSSLHTSSPSSLHTSTPSSLHTTTPSSLHRTSNATRMLQDNVHLPTFTPDQTIELPRVPILPQTQRAPPLVEIATPLQEDTEISTAAHEDTHFVRPGGGSHDTKEHLQSDQSKRRSSTAKSSASAETEGFWGSNAAEFKFVPEQGEVPAQDKGVLLGVVGAAALWGLFGPGKKKERK